MESHDHEQLVPLDGSRRSFLGVLLGLASTFVGVLLAIPVLRYIFYPVTLARKIQTGWKLAHWQVFPTSKRLCAERSILKQRDGWLETASQPIVYIIKEGGQLKALSAICTHLGCTVPWDPGRNDLCAHVMAALILRTARISRGRHAARSIRWKPK